MLYQKNSIRNQVLFGFLAITLITILTVSSSFFHLDNATEVRKLGRSIKQAEISLLKQTNLHRYFLESEVVDSILYITGENQFLSNSQNQSKQIALSLAEINQHPKLKSFELHEEIESLAQDFADFNKLFLKVVEKQRKRGFKDWGLEGEMRSFAHLLESSTSIPQAQLLTLRRHEKDFFLRKQDRYVTLFNQLADRIEERISADQFALQALQNYRDRFNKVVALEIEIGNIYYKGLKGQLFELSASMNERLEGIAMKASVREEAIVSNLKTGYVFSVIFSVVLSLLLSYLIANKIAKPIQRLSAEMNSLLRNPDQLDAKISLKGAAKEVRVLNKVFQKLISRLGTQFEELRAQSEDLRDKNDELIKVNNELDQFVYAASHDLRSPLTSALGLLQIIKIEKNPVQKEEALAFLEKSLHKLNNFTGEILSLSRNSRTEVECHPVDLQSLICEIYDQQQLHHPTNPVVLKMDIDESVTLVSDPKRLRMVFNNLISNAVRYHRMTEEKPFVSIKGTVDEDAAILEVSDNGLGIERQHLEHIFKMFYRATTEKHGSGLGLYIVKEAIGKLQGDISVQSEVNQGTTFTLIIPNMIKVRKLEGKVA